MKPATTFRQQLENLKLRNMTFQNESAAIELLSSTNYYRLTGYWLTYYDSHKHDHFRDGTTFEDVITLYKFDSALRKIISGILESIEIAIRTSIAYYMGHEGTLSYLDSNFFSNPSVHCTFVQILNKSIHDARKGKELFVLHHDERHEGMLPIWAAVEIVTFTTLAKFFSNLEPEHQRSISETFHGIPPYYFQSWIQSLSMTRNTCAHHGRIYNKQTTHRPKLFPDDKHLGMTPFVFPSLFTAGILLPSTDEWLSFITELEGLFEAHSHIVDLSLLGFPPDWIRIFRDTVLTRRFVVRTKRSKSIEDLSK